MSVIFKPVFKPVFKPLVDPTLVGSIQKTLSTALGWFDPTTIVGANPVTQWQNRGVGLSGYDLDTVVGTDANLITLESGVALLTGTIGDHLSTPDSAAASITGNIDIRWRVALADYTPAALEQMVSKLLVNTNRAYRVFLNTDGTLALQTSADGSAILTNTATAATGVTDGTVAWFKVTLDINDGAGNRVVEFFKSSENVLDSDDVVIWTQIGTTVTTAGATTINDGSEDLVIGANPGASSPLTGKVYRAQIYDVIGGSDAKVDFDPTKATVNTATFTSGGVVWTANGDAFVNATRHTGIYSRGSVGLETTAGQTVTSPATVYAVFKPTLAAPGANQVLFDARSDAGARMLVETLDASSDKYTLFQGSANVSLSEAYDSNLRVITAQFNGGAASKLTLSDVGSVTGDGGSDDWDFGSIFMTIGGAQTAQGLYLELQIYDTAHSAGQRSLLQNHLLAKFS